jgi:hypothetical protein
MTDVLEGKYVLYPELVGIFVLHFREGNGR